MLLQFNCKFEVCGSSQTITNVPAVDKTHTEHHYLMMFGCFSEISVCIFKMFSLLTLQEKGL